MKGQKYYVGKVPVLKSVYHEAEYKAYDHTVGNYLSAIFTLGIAVAAGGTEKKIRNEYWEFPENEKTFTYAIP